MTVKEILNQAQAIQSISDNDMLKAVQQIGAWHRAAGLVEGMASVQAMVCDLNPNASIHAVMSRVTSDAAMFQIKVLMRERIARGEEDFIRYYGAEVQS